MRRPRTILKSAMQSRPSKYLLVLAFFVLVPVLIGLLLGAGRTGVAMHLPWAYGLLFWVAASLGVWLCLYLGSALAGFVLRPWQPSLWVILLVGAVLGSLPARHWIYLLAAALGQRMLNGRRPQAAPALELSWEFAIYYLQVWVGVYAVWVAAGLVFDRWFAFPAYSRTRFSAVPPGHGLPPPTGGPAGGSDRGVARGAWQRRRSEPGTGGCR